MAKGMATCVVCGRDFALMAEEHYTARDTEKNGMIPSITGEQEPVLYDAFDCPHCGCQNVMKERKRGCDECECTDGDTAEVDHDGCIGCAHENLSGSEEPCASCMHNYCDNYELREE